MKGMPKNHLFLILVVTIASRVGTVDPSFFGQILVFAAIGPCCKLTFVGWFSLLLSSQMPVKSSKKAKGKKLASQSFWVKRAVTARFGKDWSADACFAKYQKAVGKGLLHLG